MRSPAVNDRSACRKAGEIKALHPEINRAQRARSFPYIIYLFENEDGYLCLNIAKVNKRQKKEYVILREYPNLSSTKASLNRILEEFELCQKYCHVDHVSTPCFYYHLHKCYGACLGEEPPEDYNGRVEEAIASLSVDFLEDFIIYDKGRHEEERSVVLVEEGQYKGYGYIDITEATDSAEEVREIIQPCEHNPEVARIIQQYLVKNKVEKIIRLGNQ